MSNIYDKSSLVLIPSGTKTGKVYSQKPVSGDGDFTFTRSSAATRVNADGNIEKETQNLIKNSNAFSSWSLNTGVSETSGQSGYDGSSDAWQISLTAAAGRLQQSNTESGVQTFSAYAKAGSLNWFRLFISAGSNVSAFFNLSSGVVGTTSNVIDTNIESVSGATGWYKCSVTYNQTNASVRIYPATADNDLTATSGNIYIQDAQLEQGLVARDYIETTTTAVEGGITDNVPRLDYTDSSCPALLLEPQRRNILPHSEYFDDFTTTRSSLDFGHTSPEGLDNAYKLVSDNTAGASHILKTQNITITASNDYTTSVFVKAAGVNWVALMFTDTSVSDQAQAWFNISNGTKGISSDGGNASMVDYDIVDYGNGWYRIYIVADLGGDTTCQARLYLAEGDNDSVFDGDGTSGAYIYGFQIEDNGAGGGTSYATSYIPTYGSSVTRVYEGMTLQSMSNNITSGVSAASLYVNYEYTLNSLNDVFCFGQNNNFYPAGRGYIYSTGNGFADSFGGGGFPITQGADTKTIWRLNTLSNTNIFQNGVKGSTRTGTAWEKVDQISFRGSFGTIKLKEMILFNSAITDQEAIDLTTI